MAWNGGGVLDIKKAAVRGPVDISGVLAAGDAGAERMGQAYDEAGASLQSSVAAAQPAAATATAEPQWEPTEFAINDKTGEVQLPNGTVVKGDAPTLMQLATLQSKDGSSLPKLQRVQKGFRPISQAKMREIISGIPVESDFFGESWAAAKSTLGLMASAIDSMVGNDDPGNSWSDAQQDLSKSQTIGQVKAGQGRWYSSFDAFKSQLGETAGNVAGSIIGALPVAAAGAVATGNPLGALLGAGAAVSGGGAAYGEQATQFYDDALATMQKMSPDTLMAESPMYRQILRENPEMEFDEAMREVAIRGARIAGTTAGMLGAVEGMIGGRLAGNFLARMGVNKALLGGVDKKAGRLAQAGWLVGRAGAGGVAAGAEEMGESMLGQAAGASVTGVGSDNPMDYASLDEGIAASLGGGIFGALGGRGKRTEQGTALDSIDPASIVQGSDIAAALGGNDNFNQPWNQSSELTADQDQIPAALRRGAVATNPGPIPGGMPAAQPAPSERIQVAQQIAAVLDERYSDAEGNWQDKIDLIQSQPQGRLMLQQLQEVLAAEDAEQGVVQEPAGVRGFGQPMPGEAPNQRVLPFDDGTTAAPPGLGMSAPLEGEAPPMDPGMDPAQQMLPLANDSGVSMSEDDGTRMPLNLRERRMMQEQRQQGMAEQSAAAPQALGQDPSVDLENQIYTMQDNIEQMKAALAQRPPRDPRKKFFVQSIRDAEDQLTALEDQWVAQREQEGPRGVAPEARVDSPEPLGAPTERMPDGRPMGVTPAALPNPEPMAPAEAQSRANTQQERRGGEDALTADQVAAAAATTDQQVSPSTPEPLADVKAQLQDLADPASTRSAVFIAADPQTGRQPTSPPVPKGVIVARREGTGVLYTTDPAKANRFSDLSKKLTDKDLQGMLGLSQSKGDALRRGKGKAPVAVQAVTKTGAIAAEQLTAPQDVPAAKKSLKKLSPNAKVEVTTPEAVQERRSLKGREPKSKPKKSLKKPKADEEKTEVETKVGRVTLTDRGTEFEGTREIRATLPDGTLVGDMVYSSAESTGLQVSVEPKYRRMGIATAMLDAAKRKGGNIDTDPAARSKDGAAFRKAYDAPAKHTRVSNKDLDDTTVAERALTADKTSATPAAPADVVAKAGTRKAVTVTIGSEPRQLPTRLTTSTGAKGATVDMRVEVLDGAQLESLERDIKNGTMRAVDLTEAKAALRDFDQLALLLDAAVTEAEGKLAKVLADAPDGEALLAKHKEESKGKKDSPIAGVPLVISEIRGFLKAVRAEAKAEMSTYSPANSVARQLVTALLPKMQNAMESALDGRQVLKQLAALSDADLEGLLRATHSGLADSTVAKQAMRGATAVAHATRRIELEAVGTRKAVEGKIAVESVETKVLPHVTEHGKIPAGVQGVVNEWIQQFEKGGNTFSAPVHVMSIDDARVLFPSAFGESTPNGKFLRRVDENGKVTGYVLAVNWDNLKQEGAAIERLAHEYGHLVTTELYSRASLSSQRAIDNAYQRWLTSTRGRSVDDVLRDQMPGFERMAFKGGATDMAYATDFWEWSARNAALYLMDPKRPHLSAVEKFFKAAADALRSIFATITGSPQPDHAWAEAMDHWIAGVAKVTTMPRAEEVNYNLEAFNGPAEPTDKLRSANMAKQAKVGLDGLISLLPGRETTAEGREVMNDIVKGKPAQLLKQLGLSLRTLRQIERKFRDTPIGPALTGWTRNQQQKAQTANRALAPGTYWVGRANQFDAKVQTAFEKIMYQTTHSGIHPDVPFGEEAEVTVKRMVDGTLKTVKVKLSNKHLLNGSAYVQGVQRKRYESIRAQWNAVQRADANTAEIYRGMRDAFTELHTMTLDKKVELITSSNFSQPVKDDIIARMKGSERVHREGPYFPFTRVGDWIVTVQLPAFFVGKGSKEGGESFDSKAAAREEMRNQKALNPGAKVKVEPMDGKYVVRVFQSGVYYFNSEAEASSDATKAMIEAEVRENYDAAGVDYDDALAAKEPLDGEATIDGLIISPPMGAIDDYETLKQVSPEMLNEIRSLLAEGKMDPEVANTIERLAIESMPESSYRKSLLPRQNVFGASKQMLRSYATRFQGAAHHYSVVEHGAAINRNWAAMREVRRTYGPAAGVTNILGANQKAIADRTKDTKTNDVLNFITNLSSMFSLAFAPAYVLMNSLQPPMVTTPVLAGLTGANGKSIGMVKAAKYLKDAYGEAPGFFTTRGIQDFVNETKALMGKRGDDHTLQDGAKEIIEKFGKTAEERAMLTSLLERGTLDFSWLNALEDAMRAGNKISQKWAALQRVGMALPQQVEAMNRVVTALAAYRLAKDEKMFTDETTLQQFADDTVADTQLDYSRLNRPLAFNKPGLNVILQFKLYMQGMYMLFARNASLAMAKPLPGESVEAHKARRQQGRRTIMYLLGTHAAGAGTMGLGPVTYAAKLALVAFAAMNDDDDDDWKSGEQLYKEMTTDLFGEFGGQVAQHGIFALMGTDMTDRIGLPVPYDPRFAGTKASDSAATGMDKALIYFMGAPYSNFRRMWQGASDLAAGDLGKAANGLPSGVRAVARSAKWLSEGIVNQNGDTFIKRDELSWGDLVINTLGLQPLKTSNAYSQRSEEKNTVAEIMLERKRLLQEARTGGDITEDLAEFNRKTPKKWRLSVDDIRKSKSSKAQRESGKPNADEKAIKDYLK